MTQQKNSTDDLDSKYIKYNSEPIGVLSQADVVVAGGGIAGIFAALSAAQEGAKTILIERFSTVGGNYGPGLNSRHDLWQHPSQHSRGPGGLVSEFLEELKQIGGLKGFPFLRLNETEGQNESDWGWDNMPPLPVIDREAFAYLALKKLRQANVTMLLDTTVIDIIMQDNQVTGLIVFSQQAQHAVLGKVFIDCSGDSIVALKAGATIEPRSSFSHSGFGLFFQIAGVDWDTYINFQKQALSKPPSKENQQWLDDVFYPELGSSSACWARHLLPSIKKAWETGEYRYIQDCDGLAKLYFVPFGVHDLDTGCVQYGPDSKVDTSNPVHLSRIQAKSRIYIYETVQFLRKYAPGFENAHIAQIAPLFNSRYGNMLDSEYQYPNEDIWSTKQFNDVIYRLTHLYKNWTEPGITRKLVNIEAGEEGVEYEVPYRLLIPKNVDALMAAGKAINSNTQSRLRGRWIVMVTGCIAGIAANLAVGSDVNPRNVDIKSLQQKLVKQGFYLGDEKRLAELGLAEI